MANVDGCVLDIVAELTGTKSKPLYILSFDSLASNHNCPLIGFNGAVVLENTVCESGFIYAGVPAKKIKPISPEVFKNTVSRIADNYLMYAGWFNVSDTE